MNPTPVRYKKLISGGTMALAVASSVFAQEKPFAQPGTGQPPAPPAPPKKVEGAATATAPLDEPEPNAVEKLFNGKIPEAIANGKFNLNARLRYEYADQDGVATITDPSHAATLRTRFGFTTAPVHGFQAMLEAEDIRVLGPRHNFNAAGANGIGDKPVVADPPTTELNQAWLSYSYTNLVTVKGGRERLVFDNHRFVGDVGWRQNMQTFDAVGTEIKPLGGLNLNYAYLWDVHRVFGDVSGLPAASPNHDFQSSSHLINVAYAPCQYFRAVGYAYLLDLDLQNGIAASRNASSATYGGYLAGSAPVSEKLYLGCRGEFAWQTDHARSTLEYSAIYYNLEVSATLNPFAFGAGSEVLGSGQNDGAGGGRSSFRTPLATLHAFNGWADVFLNTPNNGLRDLYAFTQVTLPYQIPVRFVYHKFDADSGNDDYGQEFDVMISRKFGRNWSALLKYACYLGQDAAAPALAVANVDVQRLWAQLEFNF